MAKPCPWRGTKDPRDFESESERLEAKEKAVRARPGGRKVKFNLDLSENRVRLHNLSALPGSRRKKTRKGRGYGAGQGGTCGYGTRGQKARSGKGPRAGFEGGQNPLYRSTPKLKGICGGMSAGVPKFITVNLDTISKCGFEAGETVTLDKLKEMGVIKAQGKKRNLPLKVLGKGDGVNVNFAAASFTEGAKEKIEAAGGSVEIVPLKPKWTRAAHEANLAAAA